jgi:serine/threonine-protein kinase
VAPTSSDPTLPGNEDERGIAPGGRWGRYVVLGELGSGGMGLVLAAHDPALDRKVALKLLAQPYRGWNGAGAARIEREAQAMARLAHPATDGGLTLGAKNLYERRPISTSR